LFVDNDIIVWCGLFVCKKGSMRCLPSYQLGWILWVVRESVEKCKISLAIVLLFGEKKKTKKRQNSTSVWHRFHITYTSTLFGIVDQLGGNFVYFRCIGVWCEEYFYEKLIEDDLYSYYLTLSSTNPNIFVPLLPLPIAPLQLYQSPHDCLACFAFLGWQIWESCQAYGTFESLEWELRKLNYILNTWMMSVSFLKWGSTSSFSSTFYTCQYDCLSWFGLSNQCLMRWWSLLFQNVPSLIYFAMFLVTFGLAS